MAYIAFHRELDADWSGVDVEDHFILGLYVLVTVGLMFCNILWETRLDRSLNGLHLAISLGLICSRGEECSAQTDSDCQEELEQNDGLLSVSK